MVSALALQCSTNWATKTLQLGACQFVEFILSREKEWNIEDDVNCENTNVNEDMIVPVAIAILAIWQLDPKKFRDFNGIRTLGLCVTVAVLCQLSYKDPTLGPAGVNLVKLLQV